MLLEIDALLLVSRRIHVLNSQGDLASLVGLPTEYCAVARARDSWDALLVVGGGRLAVQVKLLLARPFREPTNLVPHLIDQASGGAFGGARACPGLCRAERLQPDLVV